MMFPFTLPHFPSTESLRPEDAPLRADAQQYAASHGTHNLKIIHALADKDEFLPNCRHDPKADPLRADEIIQLLANQGERRRIQIHDEEKVLASEALATQNTVTTNLVQKKDSINEAVFSRSLNRRRELHIYGRNSEFNTPLAESEFPMKPWSPLDEQLLRLAAISERGDFDYTGRVDRRIDDQIAKDLETFFMTGALPDKVGLVLLNALFGTLHVIHVLETNAANRSDWRTNMNTPIPLNAEGLIRVVRDMRLEHSIAPERTKIVDLLVCDKTLNGRTRVSTKEFDHLTDTLQNTTDNAHEDDLVPVRFIALGHKYRHTIVAQSCTYNFPRVNEAQLKRKVISGDNAPVTAAVVDGVSFDAVKSFEGLQDQLDVHDSHLAAAKLGHRKSFEHFRHVLNGDGTSTSKSGFHYSKSYEAFRSLMDGFESPLPEEEPTYFLTTDSISARYPGIRPGPEPFLLSRSIMVVDPHPPLFRGISPTKSVVTTPKTSHLPRRASELPTGLSHTPFVGRNYPTSPSQK
jgi:hypothetical protein